MYEIVLKDSAASTKAWASRRKNKDLAIQNETYKQLEKLRISSAAWDKRRKNKLDIHNQTYALLQEAAGLDPNSKAAKAIPDKIMQQALGSPKKRKLASDGVTLLNNDEMNLVMSHPNQAIRDAYHKATGSRCEATALKREIQKFLSHGLMTSAEAQGALAVIGTPDQYDLANAVFGFDEESA